MRHEEHGKYHRGAKTFRRGRAISLLQQIELKSIIKSAKFSNPASYKPCHSTEAE